jgi:hypothetical protein
LEIDDTDIYRLIVVLLKRRRVAVNVLVCLPLDGFLLILIVLVVLPILLWISLVFLNFFVELIILPFINLLL